MRTKTLMNRKGRMGGCRNYLHAYTLACLQHAKEHFMNHRDMRAYWNDYRSALFSPLSLMTRHIEYKRRKSKRNIRG